MKNIRTKKSLIFIFTAICLLILCACSQKGGGVSTEAQPPNFTTVPSPIDSSDENISPRPDDVSSEPTSLTDPAVFSTYKAVLLGNAEYFETSIKKNLNINQLNQAVSSDSKATAKVIRFAVIDLNNDGTEEVILWLQVNGNDNYGFEILHYQDDVVYGYVMWYRSFNLLKSDGTFSLSSSAMNSGVGILKFGDGGYSTFKVAYREANYDVNGISDISYIVNDEVATQAQFDAVFDKQDEKPDAMWYDFTDDDIETVFPDN